jgi:hypothetical protein
MDADWVLKFLNMRAERHLSYQRLDLDGSIVLHKAQARSGVKLKFKTGNLTARGMGKLGVCT